MITETATVTNIDGDEVTVSASVKSGCSQCQVADDCGTSSVAKAFTPRQQLLVLRSPLPLKVGDLVLLGIPEQQVLLASWMLYVVPLLMLIGVSVALTTVTVWHELAVFGLALVATTLSFWLVSRYFKKQKSAKYEPVIIRKQTQLAKPA